MKRVLKTLIAMLVLLAVFSVSFAETADPAAGQDIAKRILVIETTDIHGYIMDASSGNPETFQYRLARIARMVNDARSSGEYDDVLLLDGGDLYQGTPVSNLTGGAAVRAALDAMDYDAIALGNHEFDWDVTEYAADREGTIAPYVLGDYFGDEKTPILASDLYDAATGKRVDFTRDYTVVEKAGLKIAVVGYIRDYTMSIMYEKIAPYSIDPDTDKLNALIRRVWENEKPDALVVLAHEDPAEVAEDLDPSLVCLVAGGHTHQITADRADNGIPCIQGNYYANGFASAVLEFSADGEVAVSDIKYTGITDDRESLYDTAENAALFDPEIMEISRATWDVVQEQMREVLGYTDTPILVERKVGACSAGNWITGLMLQAVKENGAVAAFYNTGGLRSNLEIPEGQTTREITVYDMYTITPFTNNLLLFDLTGRELATLLEQGLKQSNIGDQMSGLTFTYTASGNPDTPREEREYTVRSITLDDGTAVDINGTDTLYRICTTNFSATKPDCVYEGKEPVIRESDAPVDVEAFITLLRKNRDENGGYIYVDTGERGVEITE